MPTPANRPRNQSNSPFSGCAIIIAAVVMMIFLVAFTIWSMFRVSKEFVGFTDDKPMAIEFLEPAKHENQFNDLSRRLEGFAAKVSLDEPAELRLSTFDLNLAISSYEQFKQLKGNFSLSQITENELRAKISYKLNAPPVGDKKPRYLNGILIGKPSLQAGQILLELSEIDSEVGEVPAPYVAEISSHQITAPYLKDPKIGPYMKKLTSVSLAHDTLVLSFNPALPPPSAVGHIPTREEAMRKYGLVFGITFAALSAFLFFFLRRGK